MSNHSKDVEVLPNSMKEKLKAFNLSVLDVSGEYAKEADIAFVFLSPNSLGAAQYRDHPPFVYSEDLIIAL